MNNRRLERMGIPNKNDASDLIRLRTINEELYLDK